METKNCQNCKKDFVIESEDFNFYEKIKVPAPTWCAECRFIRRMVFRNENKLYRRTNNAPGADGAKLISIYSEDKQLTVYDHAYWWSDAWDAYSYGKEVDFSRPFFEQMKELINEVPWPNLMNWNAVKSDYCNCTSDNKNCYLVFGGDFNEDCSYGNFNFHSRDSQDLYFDNKMDLCYECSDSSDCSKVRFAQLAKNCLDSLFLYDCVNCTDCVGCIGLRSKSHCIFNQQYTKEEYKEKVKALELHTKEGIARMKEQFTNFTLQFPHRFANVIRSVDCTGENIHSSKNCTHCFDIGNVEDSKDVVFGILNLKDAHSCSHAGHGSELIYDSFGVFSGARDVKFSIYQASSINVSYTYNCPSASNLFGCVGIKKGNYAILNRRYTKEEYQELLPRVIEHMNAMPYVDAQGKEYKFGEFFPSELSPFAYNETIAFDFYPLLKEDAIAAGYKWIESEQKNYKITLLPENIPDEITDVPDAVIDEVIGCAHGGMCNDQCSTAFKIIPQELQFYRRLNLPIPDLCPNCRHYRRLRSRNPMKLWQRSCMKEGCSNEFETSYGPDRPEIIYCEKCYQQEVL